MRLKLRLRNFLPSEVMQIYRLLRTLKRALFRPLFHYKQRRVYLRLLDSKFPNLHANSSGSIALDLGANLGHFSAAAAHLGFAVKAVEPHPYAYAYLVSRFKNSSKVTLMNTAVTGSGLTVMLQVHPDHSKDPLVTSLSASLIESKFDSKHESFEVKATQLEDFFKHGECYELVKIDIEGAELYAIPQLISHATQIKRLLLETHSRFMRESEFSEEYDAQLRALENFIEKNGLKSMWFTDWV